MHIFSECLNGKEPSTELKLAYITSIREKGVRRQFTNYIEILVTSTISYNILKNIKRPNKERINQSTI